MKVLVIGSGGREHALGWKLRQSSLLTELFFAPGNPGTAALGQNLPYSSKQLVELKDFAQEQRIDLTVVGPEVPLAAGVVDLFQENGLRIFGPVQAAACLESSKSFAKEIMAAAGVATAAYSEADSLAALLSEIRRRGAPLVLKADGLAAGKGVFVCQDQISAERAAAALFAECKAAKVIIEECLVGREASYICAVNGRQILPLAASHDYKRIGDHDQGPNTGGMGTVSPTPHLSAAQEQWVLANIIRPVVAELARRGLPYRGFLYAGLMISPAGDIKVLEFNARLGDPEAQVILRRMDADLLELLWALATDEGEAEVELPAAWRKEAAVCLVLAARGYPESPQSGDPITGVAAAEQLSDIVVFQAGTVLHCGELVTAGGRVLNVTALGPDLAVARARAYAAAALIKFPGQQLRYDIGKDA